MQLLLFGLWGGGGAPLPTVPCLCQGGIRGLLRCLGRCRAVRVHGGHGLVLVLARRTGGAVGSRIRRLVLAGGALLGALAGAATDVLLHPVEKIKTRLQSAGGMVSECWSSC